MINQKICVFCASKEGTNEEFQKLAKELGAKIAKKGSGLIYGGAQVGLMGQVADAVLQNQGDVIGHPDAPPAVIGPRLQDGGKGR